MYSAKREHSGAVSPGRSLAWHHLFPVALVCLARRLLPIEEVDHPRPCLLHVLQPGYSFEADTELHANDDNDDKIL